LISPQSLLCVLPVLNCLSALQSLHPVPLTCKTHSSPGLRFCLLQEVFLAPLIQFRCQPTVTPLTYSIIKWMEKKSKGRWGNRDMKSRFSFL
jgi:hypothetical protein